MNEHDKPAFARSQSFQREKQERELELRIRAIKAAEQAAKWAKFSTVLAALALILAAWPYVRDWPAR